MQGHGVGKLIDDGAVFGEDYQLKGLKYLDQLHKVHETVQKANRLLLERSCKLEM